MRHKKNRRVWGLQCPCIQKIILFLHLVCWFQLAMSKYVINLERVKKSNFSFQKRYDIPLCVPDSINIFDNLDVPICNSSQGVVNFKHLFGSESSIPEFRCDCLDPCHQQKFKFQVKEKYDKLYYISHEIILRLKVLSRTN